MKMKFIRRLLKKFRKNSFVVEGRPVRVEMAGAFFIGIFHGYRIEQHKGVPYYTHALVELPDGHLGYFRPIDLQFIDRISCKHELEQARKQRESRMKPVEWSDFEHLDWRDHYWKRFRF